LHGENGKGRKDVIANVFRGTTNRMQNGYLLRDVINKIDGIHFTSSEEIHTLGFLYENLLKEMRDSAGDSGEFYTPRPVIKFMVTVTDLKLGETILDPACGTGGFLVESYLHLQEQCRTVEDREMLQKETIFGGEAKTLPYMLAEMNLLLHGMEYPNIRLGNSLDTPLRDIGDKDRVDIILTNPPFGGEEETGIKGNFPADMQTAETSLLFLQLIMRKLKRHGTGTNGRADVIVPDGILFGDGVAVRIKEQLLKEFNLHTIVRLPNGVFAPYTNIRTNLLFFECSGPTKEVWYYEQPLPEGRNNYTKTQPMQFVEFESCLNWWDNREENECSWKVSIEDLFADKCNLDRKSPHSMKGIEHLTPISIIEDIVNNEQVILGFISDLKRKMVSQMYYSHWPLAPLEDVLERVERPEEPIPGTIYRQIGVKWWGLGAYERESIDGGNTKYKVLFQTTENDVIINKIWTRNGSIAVIQPELSGCYVSSEFPLFRVKEDKMLPRWIHWLSKTPAFWEKM